MADATQENLMCESLKKKQNPIDSIPDSFSQAKAELQVIFPILGYSDQYFSYIGLPFWKVGFMRVKVLSSCSLLCLQHLGQAFLPCDSKGLRNNFGRKGKGGGGLKERGDGGLCFSCQYSQLLLTHQLPKAPSGSALGTKDTKMMRRHGLCV